MSESPKGTPAEYSESLLDEKYQELLSMIREQYEIEIIQSLTGGYSGAFLFLANIRKKEETSSKIIVLKLDRYDKNKNENEQHKTVLQSYSAIFRQEHLVEMAFPAIILSKKRRIALFYEVAGQSLTEYRALRAFNQQKTIFSISEDICKDLLKEWKNNTKYHPLQSGSDIVKNLFENRGKIQNNKLEEFLQKTLSINIDEGIIIDGEIFPNPYRFLQQKVINKGEREVYFPLTPQHGDLNTGNILVQYQLIKSEKNPYYLIDFLHFIPNGSCLFDILSLELSLIIDFVSRTNLSSNSILPNIAHLGSLDLSSCDFSTEFGLSEILSNIRVIINEFIQENCKTFFDDWKLSFNLAGIAIGLITANTEGLSSELRTIAYVYAASHLKNYNEIFGIVGPSKSIKLEINSKSSLQIESLPIVPNNFDVFYQACNSFSRDNLYFGIFGPFNLANCEDLQVFSRVPWSVVIDFDPDTEKAHHLLSCVKDSLNHNRFVHLINNNESNNNLNLDKACYWYAARGLSNDENNQSVDLSWKKWNKQYSKSLEDFFEKVANSTIKKVTIVVFWNESDFIEDVIKMIIRNFDDRTKIILISEPNCADTKIIDRFDLQSIPIELSNLIDGIRTRLPSVQGMGEDIVLPTYDGMGKNIKYQSLPLDIFNWLEEECEVIHINLAITQKNNPIENTSFLRGRRINWFEINLHLDVDRDLTRDLSLLLEKDLEKRERTIIQLIHNPGAGGTTIAFRVAWDLHWTYPVLVLNSFSNATTDRIRDIYTRTQQPVLVVIDSSFISITTNQINSLFEKILASRTPAVFLVVARNFSLPKKAERVFPLSQQLSNQEAFRFASVLTKEVPSKRNELDNLVSNPQKSTQRIPFVFGLTAYEEKFDGIQSFVEMRLKGISDQERMIMVVISLVSYFSNQTVPDQVFLYFLGISPTKSVNLREYVDKSRLDLLIPDENGWRPLHVLVAKETLVQLLSDNKSPERWTELLTDYGIEIIKLLSEVSTKSNTKNNLVFSSLLRGLFIDRQDAESEMQSINQYEPRFSNYIEAIPSIQGKKLVFDTLVKEFCDEPHFWGHRSRFIWNYAKNISDFKEAIESIDIALDLSVDDDSSALFHIKGMALSRWATYLMDNVKKEGDALSQESIDDKFSEIDKIVEKALEVFKHIREETRLTDERAYVSAIELLTRYIEFGKSMTQFRSFSEFFRASVGKKYYDLLQEAENLLRQARRLKVGTSGDARFIKEREVYLGKIYDDYSVLISGLQELVDKHDMYGPKYRRSLTYAYLARSDRDWDKVSEKDINRILELMEENLISDPQNNSHNIRLWFEAARRSQKIGLDYSIQKLTQWVNIANNADKLDAYYYLYALHAISAIEGSEIGPIQATKSLEMSKKLAQERTNRMSSLDWIGKNQGVSRLVSRGSLGKFQEDTSFFGPQDISKLSLLSGRVFRINTGQQGLIKAYGLYFHFTPIPRSSGTYQFIQGRDDNLPVKFYGCFSYDGPRAFSVTPN